LPSWGCGVAYIGEPGEVLAAPAAAAAAAAAAASDLD